MKVLELLNGPEKWCQQAYAKDAEGKAVNPTDEKAVCWCLGGAIGLCYEDAEEMRFEEIRELI